MSKNIHLDTFVLDIANLIEAEELKNVVLVGHSFGGLIITGLAEEMKDRIGHLVYLDASIAFNEKSLFSSFPAEAVSQRRKPAQDSSGGLSLPPPPPSAFGVSDPAQVAWVQRRLTPHLIETNLFKFSQACQPAG